MSTPSVVFPTAVPGLDLVVGGGLVPGSLVFLVGAPGAGKTILASQILFTAAEQGTGGLACAIVDAHTDDIGEVQMTDAPVQRTILIIDDDSATREFLELFLGLEGYQVRTAASGDAGLRQATIEPLALVLLDRRLPDLDGVTVCQGLRERIAADVPIIMLTADHTPALEAAARAAGATDFLSKPFAPDALLARIAAVFPA